MIRFGVLGPAAAWRDGRQLELGTPQQRMLFALLLLQRNEIVTTDRMVDVLWPSAAPPNAVQVLRTYVSRLRAGGLPASTLITRRHGYELRAEVGAVDAERLESFVAAARQELDAGRADRAEALLREALGLVRGPPLPELAEDERARADRDRLHELCAAAGEDLIDVRLAQGRHRELLPRLRAAVAADALRERAWGQLMVALYRSGRQADALAVYRDARRALVDRLGLEPGPRLRALERMILLQDASLELPVARTVPRYGTSFLGRDAELAAVTADLRTRRLVTIAGPAGAGKTRLAAEVAIRAATALGRRVWWADLDPIDRGRLVATVARALDVPEVPGRSAVDLAIARLAERPAVLVLDNCEHVIGDAARFAGRVLDAGLDTHILATSREPLHLDGERVHRLAGLPVPPDGDAPLHDYPAAQLFLGLAGAARVADEEASAVADLVARLDGLPLAIELAAGRLDSFSTTELASALAERLSLIGGGTPVAPARQRTLETAIAWSHDLVTAIERRVLRRLSIFPTSFDSSAAVAVAAGKGVEPAAVLPALARLVDASLLVADRRASATRYRLLLTVRAFARERLREAGEMDSAARRHRDAYLALAEEVGRDTFDGRLAEGLRRGRPEHENFQAALRWSLDQGDWEPAIRLAASLASYWFRIGSVRGRREPLEQAIGHAPPDDPWRPLALVGRAMLAHAAAAPDALKVADEAVGACSAAGDVRRLVIALVWRARALLVANRLSDARTDLTRASALAARARSEEGLAFADQVRGCVQLRAGDLEGAAALLMRARDRYRRLRGSLDAGYTLIDLARVRLAQGRDGEALQAAGDALTDFRRREDPRGIAQALICLGRAHAVLGDHRRSRTALDEALGLAHRWGLAAEAADAERALGAPPASWQVDEPGEEPALRAGVEALTEEGALAVGDVLREQGDHDVGVAEQLR